MQFPQQIVTELIISDPATGNPVIQIGPGPQIIIGPTGKRIVIDGIKGVIDIFNAIGTLIAELGNGIPLTIVEGNITYTLTQDAAGDGIPGMRWTNTVSGKFAFLNAVSDGSGSPQIGINSGFYTDSLGRQARSRLFLGGTQGVDIGSISTSGADGGHVVLGDDRAILTYYEADVQKGTLQIFNTGVVSLGSGPAQFGTDTYLQLNGAGSHTAYLNLNNSVPNYLLFSVVNSTATVSVGNETWHTLTLSNAWVAAGAPWATPAVRQMPDGTILLRGLITSGTNANGTVLFTLPVGYRPTSTVGFLCQGDATISPFLANVQIATTGAVTVFNLGTAKAVVLDNIRFPII